MLVPTYLLPHRASHHAKLGDTGLGPTWDVNGVALRCRATPKLRRIERDRQGVGNTRTVEDITKVQTNYSALVVGDRVVWAGRTLAVLSVSELPDPWGRTSWWAAELGVAP